MTEQLTTPDACKVLGYGRTTLFKLRKRGEIRATGRGRLLRWPRRELERWIDRNTKAAR